MNPFTTLPKLIRSKKYVDELRQDVKTMNKANWKTTAAGIVTGLAMLATIWAPQEYQGKIQATIAALGAMGIGTLAKDHSN